MTAIVDPIIALLQPQLAAIGALTIGKAGDLAAAAEQLRNDRALFVLYDSESAGPNELATAAHQQKLTLRFMVAAGFTNVGPLAADYSGALETIRAGLLAHLCGWQHPSFPSATGVAYRGSAPVDLDFNKRTAIHAFAFSFDHWIRT